MDKHRIKEIENKATKQPFEKSDIFGSMAVAGEYSSKGNGNPRGRPIGTCLPPEERKIRVNFTLPPDLARAFRDYCEREDLRMSTLVAEMIAVRIGHGEAAQ